MPKLLEPGTLVAWFGDSHSEALGPRMARMLPEQLGVRFVRPPEARRGWSTRRFLRAGDVPQLVRGAEVVIVELGGNDAAAHIGPAAHAADVQRMLQQIGNKKVIWIGPGVTLREDLERYRGPIRAAQREVVQRAGGVWIDSQPLTRAQDLRSDQVHFSRSGYDHWARQLVPKLAKAGSTTFDTAWIGPIAVASTATIAFIAWLWSRQ